MVKALHSDFFDSRIDARVRKVLGELGFAPSPPPPRKRATPKPPLSVLPGGKARGDQAEQDPDEPDK